MLRMILTLLTLAILLAACGGDPAPEIEIPPWAKVAPEQIAEAEKHGVPVAFENNLGMRFVLIPAGTFLMGSPYNEGGRYSDETQHQVTISQPFYMQVSPRDWYERVVAQHGGATSHTVAHCFPDTYGGAVFFAQVLTRMNALQSYRLPTEAEWEFACRAGESGHLSRQASGGGESVDTESPVRVYLPSSGVPNRWGLREMLSRFPEWCADWYGPYPQGPVVDPVGPATGEHRVLRGRGKIDSKRIARAACRDWDRPNSQNRFRLVSPLPEPDA